MDKEDLDNWCRKKGHKSINFLSISPAKLIGYKLVFNYYSSIRGDSAANIMESQGDCVYGLLVEIEDHDLETIRKKEGFPNYYDEVCVKVKKFDRTFVEGVKTYKVVKNKEISEH